MPSPTKCKVLLVQPPIQDFYQTDIRLQPIGLAYLKAAVCRDLPEVEVKILDFHQGWGRQTIRWPQELHYLRDYYGTRDTSPFSTFHEYFHFGATYEKIAALCAEEKPAVVGISALFSPYYREALETARVIKAVTGACIVMGGSHVSAMPEMVLQDPAVDFVIRGEGELAFVEFLRAFMQGGSSAAYGAVANLGRKENGGLVLNPIGESQPLDSLAIADLSDFALHRYTFERKPMCFMITSRSCPHHCSFCSVHQTFGHSYRRHSVQRVIDEMHQRYAEGYRVFDFEDDNLTYFRDEMKDLCRRIIAEFPAGALQLLAMNGISYLSLDDEMLQLMRRAGFTNLNLALVSSDKSVRESTKRPHTVEKYLQVIDTAQALGLHVTSYQILGLPNETLASMMQTLAFNAQQPVLMGASMFYLTPESPIARQMNHCATPTDVFRSRLTAMAVETAECSRDDLYTLFITTRIVNFIKSILGRDELNWEDLAVRCQDDSRAQLALNDLHYLLNSGLLRRRHRGAMAIVKKFNAALFRRVWNDLTVIVGPQGGSVALVTSRGSRGIVPRFATNHLHGAQHS